MVGPALLLLLAIHEVYSALLTPQDYPFGWEGGGWKYRAPENYVAANIWTIVITSSCIVGTIYGRRAIILWPARILSAVATIPVLTLLTIEGLGLLGLPTSAIRAGVAADIWIPIALFPYVGTVPG